MREPKVSVHRQLHQSFWMFLGSAMACNLTNNSCSYGAVADCGSAIDAIGWGPGSAWRHAIMDRA